MREFVPFLVFFFLFTPNIHAQQRSIKIQPKDRSRIALLIGNSDYKKFLKNPSNDVKAVRDKLKKLGFKVYLHENCSKRDMKRAIDQFGEKLKGQDVGLFFYAGHGVQTNNHNYLIPVNVELNSENEAEYECVRADRILARMEDAGKQINIVILDACRNNPFEKRWRGATRGNGLAFMNAPHGSLIAYSTPPGQTAQDGVGTHSPYTNALLEHIATPDITVLEMFQKVRSSVMLQSKGKQVPWESTSLTRSFYFSTADPNRQRSEETIQLQQALIEKLKADLKGGKSETSPYSDFDVIEFDGDFILFANGIVRQLETDLEWFANPGKRMNYKDANEWAENLEVDGRSWRLPTSNELETLIRQGKSWAYLPSILNKDKRILSIFWTNKKLDSHFVEAFFWRSRNRKKIRKEWAEEINVFAVRHYQE